jgi:hypothetical protein
MLRDFFLRGVTSASECLVHRLLTTLRPLKLGWFRPAVRPALVRSLSLLSGMELASSLVLGPDSWAGLDQCDMVLGRLPVATWVPVLVLPTTCVPTDQVI